MQYLNPATSGPFGYPDHAIDPKDKNLEWGIRYARAAYYDWSVVYPKGVFNNNGGQYSLNRLYALGKQPITQYKKLMGVDAQTNDTWLNIDWRVRPIATLYRGKAIARLMKGEHGIVATPIDMLAKTEADQAYGRAKVKIAMREMAAQADPEMANHPGLKHQKGEAEDMEELEMRVQFGEQFNRSMDAELAVQLAFYDNDDKLFRQEIFEDLYDYGVAGYKEWLGDDNRPKFRRVDPENVVISYCKKKDFSDIVHAGEQIYVSLVDLATKTDAEGNALFSEEELCDFASTITGKWGNPTGLGLTMGTQKPYDKFQVPVLDLQFKSYDRYNYRMAVDGTGNLSFRKEDNLKRGKTSDKYNKKTYEMVYEVKWIVGTEKGYDFRKAYDQKRSVDPKKKAKTSLGYRFFSPEFYDMTASSIMERLIPRLDDYQLTIYKIQNFKARAVPAGWWIDLDALENIALSNGGVPMEPIQVLQMFYDQGVLVGRSTNIDGTNVNYKPIIPVENTALSQLMSLWNDLMNTIREIEMITGYNQITAGNPNPKTLTAGYEIADQSTEDSLFNLQFAETHLINSLANDVMVRTQQALRKGSVEGYLPAINGNTLKYVQINPNLAMRDYGIMLEEKSTYEQKQFLMTLVSEDIKNGFLDSSDAIYVIQTFNAKQAMMMLAYKVKKAKQVQQQNQMAMNQQTIQGQQESAMMTEQSKQATIQLEYDLKLRNDQMIKEMDMQIKQMELGVKNKMNADMANAKVITQEVANQGKIEAAAAKPPSQSK